MGSWPKLFIAAITFPGAASPASASSPQRSPGRRILGQREVEHGIGAAARGFSYDWVGGDIDGLQGVAKALYAYVPQVQPKKRIQ
jgi:hypothetical protein